MCELSNDHVSIVISSKGAELQSIYRKDTGIEYLWSGNPAFWGKKKSGIISHCRRTKK